MAPRFTAVQLDTLATLSTAPALQELSDADQLSFAAAVELAQAALRAVEATPAAAAAWLDLASAVVLTAAAATGSTEPAATAWIAYAAARQATVRGDLSAATAQLLLARAHWQQAGDGLMVARSGLGLTQVLTQQGRYAEAESTIRTALDQLDALGEPAALQAIAARQNLATLLSYQERHADALAVSTAARRALAALLEVAPAAERDDLVVRLARTDLAIALAQTHLDDHAAAEATLRGIGAALDATDHALERGRAAANLGHLLARTGRYAAALTAFDQATFDFLGTADVDAAQERWPRADVLFLEQARVYLALNLLPEAAAGLRRAEILLRTTGQRYELGQTLLSAGLLAAAQNDVAAAATQLDAATVIFAELGNHFWLHQVALAQIDLALRRGATAEASQRLTELLNQTPKSPISQSPNLPIPTLPSTLLWDRLTLAELHLLAAQVALAQADLPRCATWLAAAADDLGMAQLDAPPALPAIQLHLRLLHLAGQWQRAVGDNVAAQRFFGQAIDLLEAQRATFALEEVRTAYLADKTALYADLVLSLLDAPVAGDDTVAVAFAVVERARSRALLERLLAATADADATAPDAARAQVAALRQQLHWLYNRWLGESGSRGGGGGELVEAIQRCEAALTRLDQRSELRRAGWRADAEPVDLGALQATLAADQQALVYFAAGDEMLAFVVGVQHATVVRNLCRTPALAAALTELRFQLGRAEVGAGFGGDHDARRAQRLLQGAQRALRALYQLVVAPVAPVLTAAHLLIIPHGDLHLAPFAALWDGAHYLLERYTIAYAPSASVAVHHAGAAVPPQATLAALALEDASIPQALAEVQAAAAHFAEAQLFVGAAASLDGLRQAAATGDILHVATHGLFRGDNPFFSALKLADGWIDVRALYRLPLRARLVVLSACESGAVQVQGSDEAIGLARGFLGAGAAALVVSLWNVHDASAASLMSDFYNALTSDATRHTPAALRSAQLAAAHAGVHPYFWAPYVAIGA